jgi:hypothetical protein
MAFAPNHTLYAAHEYGGGIVVDSYDGSVWNNVPSIIRGVTFPADCRGISLAPGQNECYVSYMKQLTNKIKVMHWKRQ